MGIMGSKIFICLTTNSYACLNFGRFQSCCDISAIYSIVLIKLNTKKNKNEGTDICYPTCCTVRKQDTCAAALQGLTFLGKEEEMGHQSSIRKKTIPLFSIDLHTENVLLLSVQMNTERNVCFSVMSFVNLTSCFL